MIADPVLRRRALSIGRQAGCHYRFYVDRRWSGRRRWLDSASAVTGPDVLIVALSQVFLKCSVLLIEDYVDGCDSLRPSARTQLLSTVLFGNSNRTKSIDKWFYKLIYCQINPPMMGFSSLKNYMLKQFQHSIVIYFFFYLRCVDAFKNLYSNHFF